MFWPDLRKRSLPRPAFATFDSNLSCDEEASTLTPPPPPPCPPPPWTMPKLKYRFLYVVERDHDPELMPPALTNGEVLYSYSQLRGRRRAMDLGSSLCLRCPR